MSTDGGRYDVEVSSRVRRPVYWGSGDDAAVHVVRRCSWFMRTAMDAPTPYEEDVAEQLEVRAASLDHNKLGPCVVLFVFPSCMCLKYCFVFCLFFFNM